MQQASGQPHSSLNFFLDKAHLNVQARNKKLTLVYCRIAAAYGTTGHSTQFLSNPTALCHPNYRTLPYGLILRTAFNTRHHMMKLASTYNRLQRTTITSPKHITQLTLLRRIRVHAGGTTSFHIYSPLSLQAQYSSSGSQLKLGS